MSKRCNGISNCKDSFDETHCDIIFIDKQLYYKETPPLSEDDAKTKVLVNVSILAVEDPNEINMKFRIKFSLSLQW